MGSCATASAAASALLPTDFDVIGAGSTALGFVATVTGIGASLITIAGAFPH